MENFINKIIEGNCVEVMRQFDDNVIDLTVTSPPYDDLRNYKGFVFPFEDIAKELYRVTKEGGVVVWVVNDATKQEQALNKLYIFSKLVSIFTTQ